MGKAVPLPSHANMTILRRRQRSPSQSNELSSNLGLSEKSAICRNQAMYDFKRKHSNEHRVISSALCILSPFVTKRNTCFQPAIEVACGK